MLARDRSFDPALPRRPWTCLTNTLHSNFVQRDLQYPPFGFVSIFHVTQKSLCGHRLLSYRITYWVGNLVQFNMEEPRGIEPRFSG